MSYLDDDADVEMGRLRHRDVYKCSVAEWDRSAGCYTTRKEAQALSLDELILELGRRIAPLGDGLLRLSVLAIKLDQMRLREEQRRADRVTAVLTK